MMGKFADRDTSPYLLDELAVLADDYDGPLGVALAAAELTDLGILVGELVRALNDSEDLEERVRTVISDGVFELLEYPVEIHWKSGTNPRAFAKALVHCMTHDVMQELEGGTEDE